MPLTPSISHIMSTRISSSHRAPPLARAPSKYSRSRSPTTSRLFLTPPTGHLLYSQYPHQIDRQTLKPLRIIFVEVVTMALWRPDPTFYPSARLAGEAPPESLAYVVSFNPNGDSKPDAV